MTSTDTKPGSTENLEPIVFFEEEEDLNAKEFDPGSLCFCFLAFVPRGSRAAFAKKKPAVGRGSGGLPPAQASSTNLPRHSRESHLPCRTTSARIPHTPTHAPIRDSNHRPCSTVRPRTPKAPKRETGKKMRCVSDFSGESVYRKPQNLAEGDLTGLCKIRFLTVRTSR